MRPFELTFGGPFTGYVGSVAAHLVPPGALAKSSFDWVCDNVEQRIVRRAGTLNLVGKIDSVTGLGGILEVAYENGGLPGGEVSIKMQSVQGIAFHSPSTDQQAAASSDTIGFLFTEENYLLNTYGQFYYHAVYPDGVTNANMVIGKDFDSSASGLYPIYQKILPNVTPLGRFATKYQRAKHAAGSRSVVSMAGKILFPCFNSLPHFWNQQRPGNLTASTIAANRYERIYPTGHIMPMWSPKVTVPANVGGVANQSQSGPWQAGDMFFLGVIFRKFDGSFSGPTPLRAPNALMPSSGSGLTRVAGGFGLVLLNVGSIVGTYGGLTNPHYRAIQYDEIPIGDWDTDARYIVRSGKVDGSAVGALPNIGDLRIAAVIENNTQTSYLDEHGDDQVLVSDPTIVRFEGIWQPRARYMTQADQRLWAGYIQQNPAALIICPMLVGAAAESVAGAAAWVPDENQVCGNPAGVTNEGGNSKYHFYVQVSSTLLTLYRWDGNVASATTSVTNAFATYVTLQDLCDYINSDPAAITGQVGRWRCQVVPGADPTAKCADALAVTTAGEFGDTYIDSGGSKANRMRCFGNCWPGILLYSNTYLATNFPRQKSTIFNTAGGPADAKNSVRSWFYGSPNIKIVPDALGDIVGLAPLLDGLLAICARGVAIIRNVRGGNTGEDSDYLCRPMIGARGCVASRSIAWGNGWVGYLTTEGYAINDGFKEFIISGALFSPGAPVGQRGDLEFEIGQCVAALAQDDPSLAQFTAAAADGKLVIGYRSVVGVRTGNTLDDVANRNQQYDYSAGITSIGADAMLDPDGNPWGWSAPFKRRLSTFLRATKSDGRHWYGARDILQDGAWVSTVPDVSCGRIDEFDIGNTDDETVTVANVNYLSGFSELISISSLADVGIGAKVLIGGISSTVFSKPQPAPVPVALCIAANNSTTITTSTIDGFALVNVGAVPVFSGISLHDTVIAKIDNQTLQVGIPISPAISNGNITFNATVVLVEPVVSSGTSTLIFSSKAVRPMGFSRLSFVDETRGMMKRLRSGVVRFLKTSAGLTIAFARHLHASRTLDSGWSISNLPAVLLGDVVAREILTPAQSLRKPLLAIEARWSDNGDGSPPTVYSTTVEGNLMSSKV